MIYLNDSLENVETQPNYILRTQTKTNKQIVDFCLQYKSWKNTTQSYLYFSIFLFFEIFLQSKICLFSRNFQKNHESVFLDYINNSYLMVLRLYKKITKKFNLYNFLTVMFYSFMYKDLVMLKNFLIRRFNYMNFKNHKRCLLMIRYSCLLIMSFLMGYRYTRGFKLSISGKIGAAGNSKKKKWTYEIGSTDISSKLNRLKFETFQFWTTTGCLGVKMYLSY